MYTLIYIILKVLNFKLIKVLNHFKFEGTFNYFLFKIGRKVLHVHAWVCPPQKSSNSQRSLHYDKSDTVRSGPDCVWNESERKIAFTHQCWLLEVFDSCWLQCWHRIKALPWPDSWLEPIFKVAWTDLVFSFFSFPILSRLYWLVIRS